MSKLNRIGAVINGHVAEEVAKRVHEIAHDLISDNDDFNERLNDDTGRLIEELAQKFKVPEWVIAAIVDKQDYWRIAPVRPRLIKGKMPLSAQEVEDAKDLYGED